MVQTKTLDSTYKFLELTSDTPHDSTASIVLRSVVIGSGPAGNSVSFGIVLASAAPPMGTGTLSLGYAPAGSDTTSKPRFAEVYSLAATLTSVGCIVPPGPPPPLVITTPSPLPPGTVGAQYSQTFTTTGGTPPITLSEFGNFPPMLGFSAKGVMSGIPLQAGTYNFVVEADD